jgi:phage gpG-like protein
MKDLPTLLKAKASAITSYLKTQAPKVIGVEAKNHFREGFVNEGFTDKALEPWEEVKRREDAALKRNKNGKVSKSQPRDQRRKILSDAGTLKNSIDYSITGNEIEVGTDDVKGKAEAHNEGTTTAGRGNSTTIPKRQFIGQSNQLEQKIKAKFERDVTKILQT